MCVQASPEDHGGAMSDWIPLRGVWRAPSGFGARLREQAYDDFFSGIIWTAVECIVAIARLRTHGAEFDRATSTIRIGKRTVKLTEIVSARIDPFLLESGVLILRFGDPDGLELNAYLRAGSDSVSPQSTREVLAEILHASSISQARRGHKQRRASKDSAAPISMTRNEAIALVLDAPPIDADLPLTH